MATQVSMNISLPDTLRKWVEDRIAAEGYGTASEYFRLGSRRSKMQGRRSGRKLVAALDSGPATEMGRNKTGVTSAKQFANAWQAAREMIAVVLRDLFRLSELPNILARAVLPPPNDSWTRPRRRSSK